MITTLGDLVFHIIWLPCWIFLLLLSSAPVIWSVSRFDIDSIYGYFVIIVTLVFSEFLWIALIVVLLPNLRAKYGRRVESEGRFQAYGSLDTWTPRWFAIRTPGWQESISEDLCKTCCDILRSSPLLGGSWRVFVSANETYVYNTQPLEDTISGPRYSPCQLCSLLYSTLRSQQHSADEQDSILPIHHRRYYDYGTLSSAQYDEPAHSILHIFEAVGTEGVTHVQLTMHGYSSPAFTVFRGKSPSPTL
jgi:hypothetical protein